jgi:hypothetical protein
VGIKTIPNVTIWNMFVLMPVPAAVRLIATLANQFAVSLHMFFQIKLSIKLLQKI